MTRREITVQLYLFKKDSIMLFIYQVVSRLLHSCIPSMLMEMYQHSNQSQQQQNLLLNQTVLEMFIILGGIDSLAGQSNAKNRKGYF